jgi:hypothetical protein
MVGNGFFTQPHLNHTGATFNLGRKGAEGQDVDAGSCSELAKRLADRDDSFAGFSGNTQD